MDVASNSEPHINGQLVVYCYSFINWKVFACKCQAMDSCAKTAKYCCKDGLLFGDLETAILNWTHHMAVIINVSCST